MIYAQYDGIVHPPHEHFNSIWKGKRFNEDGTVDNLIYDKWGYTGRWIEGPLGVITIVYPMGIKDTLTREGNTYDVLNGEMELLGCKVKFQLRIKLNDNKTGFSQENA